jgi:uncharacterized RmlC-like cupin family protein
MDRQEAFSTDRMWAGLVRTEPGMVSGWHHHGDHETAVSVVSGSLRMEFGPSGSNSIDASPGDFLCRRGSCTGRATLSRSPRKSS